MRTVRSEEGFAIPLVVSILAIVLGFAAVAVTLATHNVDRAERDRTSSRALQAADAGLDAAAYRMNKTLLATKVDNLLSPATLAAVLAEVGCLELTAGTSLNASLNTPGTCGGNQAEMVDSEVDGDGLGQSASFRYYIKLRANVLVSGRSVLERQIISIGEVDGIVRKVSGIYRFDLEAPANSVVTRSYYTECSATVPEDSSDDPAEGCPTV